MKTWCHTWPPKFHFASRSHLGAEHVFPNVECQDVSNAFSSHLLCIILGKQTTRELLEQEAEQIQPLTIFFYRHIIQRGPIADYSQSAGYELCHFRSCTDVIAWSTLRGICLRHTLHQRLDQRHLRACWLSCAALVPLAMLSASTSCKAVTACDSPDLSAQGLGNPSVSNHSWPLWLSSVCQYKSVLKAHVEKIWSFYSRLVMLKNMI